MERDRVLKCPDSMDENFNSHAHVERDGQLTYRKIRRYISTHTLTWSVTSLAVAAKTADGISTHTLTWSVTY